MKRRQDTRTLVHPGFADAGDRTVRPLPIAGHVRAVRAVAPPRRIGWWTLLGAAVILVPTFLVLGSWWQQIVRDLVGADRANRTYYLLILVISFAVAALLLAAGRGLRTVAATHRRRVALRPRTDRENRECRRARRRPVLRRQRRPLRGPARPRQRQPRRRRPRHGRRRHPAHRAGTVGLTGLGGTVGFTGQGGAHVRRRSRRSARTRATPRAPSRRSRITWWPN
nr:hypothetical protein JVH1_4902 [Rhodococcus sp. JVH1]